MADWTEAKILYFHFNSTGGNFASLPMTRTLKAFAHEFKGIPGTLEGVVHGRKAWIVPGYKCMNCAKTFFAAKQEDLKHACMSGNGGIISDSRSMGV